MESKRREKYKQRKKRKILITKIFSFILLGIIIIFFLNKLGFFNVNSIEVVGNKDVSKSEIIKRSSFEIGNNFFDISKKNRETDINSIPKIKESKIKFYIGGKIKILVTERDPIMQINNYTDYYIIDNEFRLIDILNKPLVDCKYLYGINVNKVKLGDYLLKKEDKKKEFLKALFKSQTIFKEIEKIELKNKKVLLSNKDNLEIDFGSYNDIEYKLDMLKQILEDIRSSNRNISKIYMEQGKNPVAVEETDYNKNSNLIEEKANDSNEIMESNSIN
ncbi:MAG: cell division protein FtsQ/DivIB [Peptoniphilaceae bacterium]